jgi:hypothetical protein
MDTPNGNVTRDRRTVLRRLVVVVAGWTLLIGLLAVPGLTEENDVPLHGHIMLQHVEVDESGSPIGYRRCVELANGRHVPLHAHHDNLHLQMYGDPGRAALALAGHAGHWVIPTAPLTPWTDCAGFAAFMAAAP